MKKSKLTEEQIAFALRGQHKGSRGMSGQKRRTQWSHASSTERTRTHLSTETTPTQWKWGQKNGFGHKQVKN